MKTNIFECFILLFFAMGAWAGDLERQVAVRESYQLESQKNFPGAIKALAGAYNADSKDYFLNLRMGWLNYVLGNYKNAIKHYDTALESRAQSMSAGIGKVNALMAQKDWSGAARANKDLSKIFPTDYAVNLKLVNIYIIEKNFEEGLKIVGDLVPYYPENVELLNTQGYLQILSGQKENAEKVFHQVLKVSPDNVIAKSHLVQLAKTK